MVKIVMSQQMVPSLVLYDICLELVLHGICLGLVLHGICLGQCFVLEM